MDRLTAWANTRNGRSQVALERAGFRREGVLRAWHRHGDTLHDVVVFGMTRPQWERSPLAAVPVEIAGTPPPAFLAAERRKNSPDVGGVNKCQDGNQGRAPLSTDTGRGVISDASSRPRTRNVNGCARSRHARRGRSGHRDRDRQRHSAAVAVDTGRCGGRRRRAGRRARRRRLPRRRRAGLQRVAEEAARGAAVPRQPQARRARPRRARRSTAGSSAPRAATPATWRATATSPTSAPAVPTSPTRLKRAGWRGSAWGETLAYGCGSTGTPRATLRNWMNSPPHREVLLSGRYRRAGLGVTDSAPCGEGAMWVLDVGRSTVASPRTSAQERRASRGEAAHAPSTRPRTRARAGAPTARARPARRRGPRALRRGPSRPTGRRSGA